MDTQALIAFIKKHPIGVGCAVLAMVLGALTFVRAGTVTELEDELMQLSSQGDRLKNNLKYSVGLDEDLAAVEAAIAEVERKTINPGALATNLQFFYRLEQELALSIIDLRQGVLVNTTQPREYLSVPYVVSVQGTYLQLIEFLHRLEQGERVVRFVSLNFSPTRGLAAQGGDPYNPIILLTLDLELLGRS